MALEREDAVKKLREVMGATNPANAAEARFVSDSPRIPSAITSMDRMRRRPRRWNWRFSSPRQTCFEILQVGQVAISVSRRVARGHSAGLTSERATAWLPGLRRPRRLHR